MQIKSILAAAVVMAFMIHGWSAIAASHDSGSASEIAIAQAKAGDMTDGPLMTKPMRKTATVSIRNTRPQTDAHKDARGCLNAGKNESIIRCAQKYR